MRGAWFVALCACGGATQPTPPAVATATRDASTRVATVATVAPVTASYSAPPCYRLDADGAGATLSCGKDSWRWSRVPPLEAFVFSPDSMLFALVANAANRFDVRVMSINGSVQSDASLAGEASGASFVRRGAVVEIEERSNARAWVDVMTGAQTSVADAAALPSRHAVETLLHARWEALGAKRIELATPEATPPFPSAHHDVTFYFYAESLSGGGSGPADAMPMTRDSSIWARRARARTKSSLPWAIRSAIRKKASARPEACRSQKRRRSSAIAIASRRRSSRNLRVARTERRSTHALLRVARGSPRAREDPPRAPRGIHRDTRVPAITFGSRRAPIATRRARRRCRSARRRDGS